MLKRMPDIRESQMSNKNPVVFVHGLLGFGPKELGPLNYWGSAFKVHSPLKRYEARMDGS